MQINPCISLKTGIISVYIFTCEEVMLPILEPPSSRLSGRRCISHQPQQLDVAPFHVFVTQNTHIQTQTPWYKTLTNLMYVHLYFILKCFIFKKTKRFSHFSWSDFQSNYHRCTKWTLERRCIASGLEWTTTLTNVSSRVKKAVGPAGASGVLEAYVRFRAPQKLTWPPA